MKQNIEIEVPQGFEAKYNPNTRVVEIVAKPQENNNGFDYVDLDLPSGTLWATCNVGAKKPEDYGDYFMWGSVTPNTNDVCDWAHAPFNGGREEFDGNFFNAVKDAICPNGILAPEYDAVHQIMGGDWRMPTKEQIQELEENTAHKWTSVNGVNGRMFTGSNGNSIFIPASGYRIGSSVGNRGSYAYVWSSSLNASSPYGAWYLNFGSGYYYVGNYYRCGGFSLRGVLEFR